MIKLVIEDKDGNILIEEPRETFTRLDLLKRRSSTEGGAFIDAFLISLICGKDDKIVQDLLALDNKEGMVVKQVDEKREITRGIYEATFSSYQSGYHPRFDDIIDDFEFVGEGMIFGVD